jgi:hypothetical protein
MARKSLKQIVEPEKIYINEEILEHNINESYIDNMFKDSLTANTTLSKLGIIKNSMKCSKCESDQQMPYTKRKDAPEGYHWMCRRPCTHSCALIKDSFFELWKLPMHVIFKIIYKYISGISFVDIACELNVDRQTAGGISDLIRECICEFISKKSEFLGRYDEYGFSKIVEIDEGMFFKRKYI